MGRNFVEGCDASVQAPSVKSALGFLPFSFFAAEQGPHISLKAEEVLNVNGFSVTNSMIYSPLIALVVLGLFIYVANRIKVRPQGGLVAIVEIIVEYVIKTLTSVFGNREKAVKFAPVFGVYFIFIMMSNLAGLLPFVGEGVASEGIPVFRPFTADLNGVVAMSVFSIAMVQYLSIRENGLGGHLKHYFTNKPLNPINMFVGFLELIGELTRIISLSLRLFLNTVIGEILIAVFIYISGAGTPLALVPIILFEALVAYIQAYIFMVLSATYLGLAIHHEHDDHEETDSYEADTTHDVNPLPKQHLREREAG